MNIKTTPRADAEQEAWLPTPACDGACWWPLQSDEIVPDRDASDRRAPDRVDTEEEQFPRRNYLDLGPDGQSVATLDSMPSECDLEVPRDARVTPATETFASGPSTTTEATSNRGSACQTSAERAPRGARMAPRATTAASGYSHITKAPPNAGTSVPSSREDAPTTPDARPALLAVGRHVAAAVENTVPVLAPPWSSTMPSLDLVKAPPPKSAASPTPAPASTPARRLAAAVARSLRRRRALKLR